MAAIDRRRYLFASILLIDQTDWGGPPSSRHGGRRSFAAI